MDGELNADKVFGHERKSYNEYYSTISVKDLFLDKDILAVSVVMFKVMEYDDQGPEDGYIRACAWLNCILDEDISEHDGDCIKQCSTCMLCMCEDMYMSGLHEYSYFKQLAEDLEIPDKYNICILYMTVYQFLEEYWTGYRVYLDDHGYSKDDKYKEYPTAGELLKRFLSMSEKEQQIRYERMVKVREYVENPVPILGIPWW